MRRFLDYLDGHWDGFLVLAVCFAIMGIGFGIGYYSLKENEATFEESCVDYYIENNYILDECMKYEKKLISFERSK